MDLGKAFEQSIIGNEIENISEESLDSMIDILSDNEIIKEIPIVKYVSSGFKIYKGIKEKAEIKNLLVFLFELKDITNIERKSLLEKIEENEDFKKHTFERVVLIIERLDELEKAKIIGKLFKNLILQNITREEFFRLSFAVERTFIYDLKALKAFFEINQKGLHDNNLSWFYKMDDQLINKQLTYIGLMIESLQNSNRGKEGFSTRTRYDYKYTISELGEDLVKYGF